MKTLMVLFLLLFTGLPVSPLKATLQESTITESRAATIIDRTGVTIEVTGLSFSYSDYPAQFDKLSRHIVINTKDFQVSTPLNVVTAIDTSGQSTEVKYISKGKEKTISGRLQLGTFMGKSNFGNIRLRSDKLKRLMFKEPPAVVKEEMAPAQNAVVTFADGTKISITDPKLRLRRPSSSQQKSVGYDRADDINFEFLLGESTVTVELKDIKLIEFGPGGITLQLKTGESATGKFSTDRGEIIGIFANYDQGECFLYIDQVKTVEFSSTITGN